MTTPETIAPTDRPTIETVRVFDAPRSLVFEAMSNEDHITQWWGPRGFTCRDNKWNFKVGGQWTFVMHHDKHGDFVNVITYTDIVEDELIAFDHGDDIDLVHFKARIEFADALDNKTQLTMRMTFPDFESRDEVAEKYGAVQGQKETFDKLAEFLEKKK